jgi:DNA polymerase I-like protein with 3'-5' exonuclease and polymerase domains/uracil-DNA glycosylase
MRAFQSPDEIYSLLPHDHPFKGWRPILGEGDDSPEIIIVKKSPSGWDMEASKPMLDPAGRSIRTALLREGVKAYYTHAVPFYKRDIKPVKKHADCTQEVVREELNRVGTRNVLLLGANAARWTPTFGVSFRRVSEVQGRVVESNGLRFYVLPDPSALANEPGLFRSFLDAIDELRGLRESSTSEVGKEHYRVLKNRVQALKALGELPRTVAFDIETTGLDPWQDRILTVQFSGEEGTGIAIPWDILTVDDWRNVFDGKRLITQNGTFDTRFLLTRGIFVQIHEDTMLMHSLIDETPGTHSMENMSNKYLGIDKWGESVDYDDMESVDIDVLGRYGARDTDITLRLANKFRPQVEGRKIHEVLIRAQNAITRSEVRGIRIDREKAQQFKHEIDCALHDRAEYLADTYGLENANSPVQVAKLLYEDLGLPEQKLKGRTTTSSPSISPFADECPAVRDILEYRHLTKAGGTYIKNILQGSEHDGRYHPDFKLAQTDTGRVSERLITLIPRSEERDDLDLGQRFQQRLRELFIPDPGMVMIGADYSSLEVRMAAFLAHESQLITDLHENRDMHSIFAIRVFGLDIPLEPWATLKKRVSANHSFERTAAKSVVFGSLYGGSAATLANNVGVEVDVAQRVIEQLYARYPRLKEWQEETRRFAVKHGFVETPWGRRRHFLFGKGMNRQAEEAQLRAAINAPIQSHASDMNLFAFARAEARGLSTLFCVHDSIYIQAPEDKAEEAAKELRDIMESTITGPVLFSADVKKGPNWACL